MDANGLAVAITGLVGVAGIASTHLLARHQRKGEIARLRAERTDRYRFADHETRSGLYADFLAELRNFMLTAQLRNRTVGSFRSRVKALVADVATPKSDTSPEARDTTDLARAVADLVEGPDERHMPPPVDTAATIRRLTELEARVRLLGDTAMVEAAEMAHRLAVSAALRVERSELMDHNEELEFDNLERATAAVEAAALYELQLRPYGEKRSLHELIAQATDEAAEGSTGL